jgi:hypothetical protein
MSLLRREPRSVYRIYAEEDGYAGDTDTDTFAAEDKYIRDTESFGAKAAEDKHPVEDAYPVDRESAGAEVGEDGCVRDTESFAAEVQMGPHRPAPTAGSLELRRRPLAFGVVGLLVLLAALVIVLVFSNISRRAPHRSAPVAPVVTTATAGHPLAAATPPSRKSILSPPLRRLQRVRRPSAKGSVGTDGDASASMSAPVPAVSAERPLPGPPAAPVTAEFGFER